MVNIKSGNAEVSTNEELSFEQTEKLIEDAVEADSTKGSIKLRLPMGYIQIGKDVSIARVASVVAAVLLPGSVIWFGAKAIYNKYGKGKNKTTSQAELAPLSHYKPAVHNGVNIGQDVSYLVSDAVRSGGLTYIFADKSVGKSTLAFQVACAVATGESCTAFPDDVAHAPQRVIYYDSEQALEDYNNRGYQDIPNLEVFCRDEFYFTSVAETIGDIKDKVFAHIADCTVIIDVITNPHFGLCLSSATDVQEFVSGLHTIQADAKNNGQIVSFIVLNHATKTTKDMFGGIELYGDATSLISIERVDKCNDVRRIRIERNRSGKEGEWLVKRISDPLHFEYIQAESSPEQTETDDKEKLKHERYERVVLNVKGGLTIEQACKQEGISRQTFYNWSKEKTVA